MLYKMLVRPRRQVQRPVRAIVHVGIYQRTMLNHVYMKREVADEAEPGTDAKQEGTRELRGTARKERGGDKRRRGRHGKYRNAPLKAVSEVRHELVSERRD